MGPCAITFLLTSMGYAMLLCPSLYWLDSGELAAGAFELGIVHAPGHPLASLLSKLFCFLPIGDIALRVGLSQVFCGAGAATVVTWLGVRIARQFMDPPQHQLVGLAAGLLYATSYAAAFQANRPEVYALSALLTFSVLALCLRYREEGDPRLLGLAGVCFGLGLANHHYLVLLGAAPPALVLVCRRNAQVARGLLFGAIGTLLGLSIYFYLPLRTAPHPIVDWGHPHNWANFYWTVSAQSFQKSGGIQASSDNADLLVSVLDQLTPFVTLMSVGGLYLCARKSLRLGLALFCAVMGPIGARWLVTFDAGNPDAFGYLSTGIAALAWCAVPLLAAFVQAAPYKFRSSACAVVLVLCIARGLFVAPSLSLARFDETHRVFSPLLEMLPRQALFVTSNFQTGFSIDYLRVVEGKRPDVHYLNRHALSHPDERQSVLRRDPALALFLGERDVDAKAVLGSQSLALEYDIDLPVLLAKQGMEISLAAVGDGVELQTRRYAIWQSFLHLHKLCRTGAEESTLRQAESELRQRAGVTEGSEHGPLEELIEHCAELRGK